MIGYLTCSTLALLTFIPWFWFCAVCLYPCELVVCALLWERPLSPWRYLYESANVWADIWGLD